MQAISIAAVYACLLPQAHMPDAYICTIISASVVAPSAVLTPAFDIPETFVNPEVQVVPQPA